MTADVAMVLQLASTISMVGLIWFVQIVHYPLMALVGERDFCRYEQLHKRRTTRVVAPLMLIEAGTGILLLWYRPDSVTIGLPIVGLILLAIVWLSTALWQVPLHDALTRKFDAGVVRRLVRSNWLRTAAWSLRGIVVLWMVASTLR